jgi:hypothetical protein
MLSIVHYSNEQKVSETGSVSLGEGVGDTYFVGSCREI